MRMFDIIDKKRNGGELTDKEISYFVDGVVDGEIPNYQTSALLMSIFFQNMTSRERTTLTKCMMESGDHLNLSEIPGIKVDKHSTGGVGDKVTIPLAPMVAAIGIPVPMISGRGLGHTGGTLDKLEAIPNFNVALTVDQFKAQVADIGLAIISTTGDIAPADKKLYALRDVTDTVDSIPLISSSIMSKKIASGTDALVIDVKTGAGAFMKTLEDSIELAHALVDIGKGAGVKCMAVISDMSQPLGEKIGNSLEIEESIDILKGKGPKDLLELTLTLGAYMAMFGGKAATFAEGKHLMETTISSGTALEKFKAMLQAQGGDVRVIDDYSIMPQAKYCIELPAKTTGVVSKLNADEIGIASMQLGGGRQKADDTLDYAVGIELHKKVGDSINAGESLLTIYSNTENISEIQDLLYANIEIGESAEIPAMIHQIIDAPEDVERI